MHHRPDPLDRRATSKARIRRAILDAAAALLDERGMGGFTVDDLAARADISRRTIFNHFGSISDVVVAVCAHQFDVALDLLEAPALDRAAQHPRSVLDDITHDLRAMDLVAPMAYLTRVLRPAVAPLGSGATVSTQIFEMYARACASLTDRLRDDLTGRHPETDVLDIDLMLAFLCAGLPVIAIRWAEVTGGTDDASSRHAFTALLERLIVSLRTGFPALAD